MKPLESLVNELNDHGLKLVVQQPEPEFIDIKQVASMLGVSPRTIRRLWSRGELPEPVKFGRSVRWRKLDLENHNYGNHLSTKKQAREAG